MRRHAMSELVYLVGGSDPVLRDRALDDLVSELIGGDDKALAVEDVTVPGKGEKTDDEGEKRDDERPQAAAAARAAAAAQSPPFLTAGRVVVVRDIGHLTKADAAPLVEYLATPLDTTALVLVAGGGTVPADLVKAVKAAGAAEVKPESEKTGDVVAGALADAGLKLRTDAAKRLTTHVGEDPGRVQRLVDVLASAFGPGTTLGIDDIEPYLGEAGPVPIYELTNAIEKGDVAGSLALLHRLMRASGSQQAKPMHPLQVMVSLQNAYRRLLPLDDPEVRTAEDAAAAIGGRTNARSARYRLEHARALGSDGLRQAFAYLAQADIDLKGARAIPEDVVMEVLVARLAHLSARARGGARRR
jgi:DNA polymerase-3 subunit delta